MKTPDKPKTYTIKEVASLTGVAPVTIRRAIKKHWLVDGHINILKEPTDKRSPYLVTAKFVKDRLGYDLTAIEQEKSEAEAQRKELISLKAENLQLKKQLAEAERQVQKLDKRVDQLIKKIPPAKD